MTKAKLWRLAAVFLAAVPIVTPTTTRDEESFDAVKAKVASAAFSRMVPRAMGVYQ